ncbi:MAG: TlyA family RNA methyltransferase [Actinobacteria bacterium]|nr:TlyA family RNA methyltransferase [Actinomycetota bacterium]
MTRRRLDSELVRRHMARSREQAQNLIESGLVRVDGVAAEKPARQVTSQTSIVLVEDGPRWVSRGAHKLLGALSEFIPQGLAVAGRRCLDAGASTGGFTQVLLSQGADRVIAVDVGYGQLDWSVRSDPRVVAFDRCNIRTLGLDQVGHPIDLVVADLSFISLRLVLPSLVALMAQSSDMLLMVKPQFEVGKNLVGDRGVVRDPGLREASVRTVRDAALALGWGSRGVVASPLPGPSGNVEYFLWLGRGPNEVSDAMIAHAVEGGPAGA